jgi:antitoxin (DNA-binding transcriptional repressor) of toxin-antitoxin stability system
MDSGRTALGADRDEHHSERFARRKRRTTGFAGVQFWTSVRQRNGNADLRTESGWKYDILTHGLVLEEQPVATVTIPEFHQNWEAILRRLEHGERFVLTIGGRRVARLEPICDALPDPDDPAYRLYEHADPEGSSLSNPEIDEILINDRGD